MKKLLLWSIAICACSLLSAQVEFGLRIGSNFGNADYEGDASEEISQTLDSRLGIYAAGIFNFRLSDYFSIQPEVAFTEKGYNFDSNTLATSLSSLFNPIGGTPAVAEDFQFINQYLEVPILGKVTIPLGEKFQFFIDAGPSFGYLLESQLRADVNGEDNTVVYSKDADNSEDNDERADFAMNYGAGFAAKLGKGWLRLDGRYQDSGDTNNFAVPGTGFNFDSNGEVTNVSLSYVIRL